MADIYCPELDSMKRLLEQALERGEGIIGFGKTLNIYINPRIDMV